MYKKGRFIGNGNTKKRYKCVYILLKKIKYYNSNVKRKQPKNIQMVRFCRQAIEIVSHMLITEKIYDRQNPLVIG